MDLTRLTHTLTISGTTHNIDEPVNFDTMKLTMKRNTDYHGISIETTEATLQFYDSPDHTAASLIKTAYETDIDTDIIYTVTDTGTAAIIYQGKLDLSTYDEKQGAYFAIECKVGEIGIKTTFNNRTETEIDLLSTTTIEGQTLAHIPAWKNLKIPAITLKYTNSLKTDDVVMTEATVPSGRFHLPANKSHHFISLNLGNKTTLNEFGEFNTGFADIADQISTQRDISGEFIDDYYQPIFSREELNEFRKKYGNEAKYNINIDITVELTFETANLFPTYEAPKTYSGQYRAQLVLLGPLSRFGQPVILAHSGSGSFPYATITNTSAAQHTDTFRIQTQTQLSQLTLSHLTLGILLINNTSYTTSTSLTPTREDRNYQVNVIAKVMPNTPGLYNGTIDMTLNSKMTTETKAELLPIHEALNAIAENLSDNTLTVKSDYYGRCDSQVNPTAGINTFGKGSLKAITSGFRLRNGYQSTTDGTKQMPVNFRQMIESLDAIDCIGWGFTTENGQTCLRIERWDYFYQDQTVLTITGPNEITKTPDTDRIITELTIGYKKYVANDEMNAAMSIHSEQTYSNRCKAINRTRSRLCEFIADMYAIEQTRRKQFENDTKEFKYDENIFILELRAQDPTTTGGSITYGIPTNYISNATGMKGSASEMYNMRITPHRNAYRWQDFLKWTNHTLEFACTSTKQNASASFGNSNSYPITIHFHDVASNMTNAEKGDLKTLSATAAKARKDIVKITYPLTLAQYQTLKANPYGIIKVDNQDYWLQEASYEFKTGKTELKLIPKAN